MIIRSKRISNILFSNCKKSIFGKYMARKSCDAIALYVPFVTPPRTLPMRHVTQRVSIIIVAYRNTFELMDKSEYGK